MLAGPVRCGGYSQQCSTLCLIFTRNLGDARLALALWAERNSHPRLWFGLLLLMPRRWTVTWSLAWPSILRNDVGSGARGREPEHRLAADAQPLALSTVQMGKAPRPHRRSSGHQRRATDVLRGLDWGGGAEYLLLLAYLASPMAAGLHLHIADRAAFGAGALLSLCQLPPRCITPAPAVVAVVACIIACGDNPNPEGHALDAVLAVVCWLALAKPGSLRAPPARLPQQSRRKSSGSDPTAGRRTHHELSGATFSQRIDVGFPQTKQTLRHGMSCCSIPATLAGGQAEEFSEIAYSSQEHESSCQSWPSAPEPCSPLLNTTAKPWKCGK